MSVVVDAAQTWSDRRAFLNLPWRLYRGDAAWVAPLKRELTRRIDPRKNPYFREAEAALCLARIGREVVGRISAQMGRGAAEGAFGFYECVDDQAVANALLAAAGAWLREHGARKMIGPCNFRLEDPAPGFLTKGFDLRPTFMMAYSKPYYPAQLECAGFATAMDLRSYSLDKEHPLPPGLLERAAHAATIPGIRVRPLRMAGLYEEAELLRGIFNESLKNNWGFVPFSAAQARQMARDLKLLADPRIVLIAEIVEGQVSDVSRTPCRAIGAVINLPNYNDILADCHGRLFPKGFYRIWRCRNRIKGLRGYAMAICPEYQGQGVGCLLLRESYAEGMRAGYTYGEITWVLGTNSSMNELAQFLGGQQQKAYRLYQKSL